MPEDRMDQIDITVFVGLSSLSIQFETLICKCGALQSYSLPLSVAYLFYLYDMLHTHQHFLSFYFLFKYFFLTFLSLLSHLQPNSAFHSHPTADSVVERTGFGTKMIPES